MLIISLPNSNTYNVDPNLSNVYGDPNAKKTVGLVYPWALRPALSQRLDDFDLFDLSVPTEMVSSITISMTGPAASTDKVFE